MSKKTFKYRLYPTRKQAASLQWTLDHCRELYNAALQERKEVYKYTGKGTTYNAQSAQLPEMKELRSEYKEIHSQVLQDVLKRVDKEVKLHREVQGTLKTCTIKREGEHWYVCFACEVEEQTKLPYTDEAIGIDLGLYHFAALSTGDLIDNPRPYRRAEKKLQRAQQALSRKKRGSNRRRKAVQRVARCHRKVRNQRNHFLHEKSRQLVNTYETIVFEDLAPSKMSKRPKPKQDEETGRYMPNGASQKAGLNKSILDAGWSQFVQRCQYKAANAGTTVVCVDPYKTSQVCSGCGEEGPHKDLSERVHTCTHCGLVLDRDVNAAVNILNVWLGRSLRTLRRVRSATGAA